MWLDGKECVQEALAVSLGLPRALLRGEGLISWLIVVVVVNGSIGRLSRICQQTPSLPWFAFRAWGLAVLGWTRGLLRAHVVYGVCLLLATPASIQGWTRRDRTLVLRGTVGALACGGPWAWPV